MKGGRAICRDTIPQIADACFKRSYGAFIHPQNTGAQFAETPFRILRTRKLLRLVRSVTTFNLTYFRPAICGPTTPHIAEASLCYARSTSTVQHRRKAGPQFAEMPFLYSVSCLITQLSVT